MNNGMLGFPGGSPQGPWAVSKSWKNRSSVRSISTWYYNSSKQELLINIYTYGSASGGAFNADIRYKLSDPLGSANGGVYQYGGFAYSGGGTYYGGQWFNIPPGTWYQIIPNQSAVYAGIWTEYSDMP